MLSNIFKYSAFRCQTFFCYLCGARLSQQDPYSHFSSISSPCYNQLFEEGARNYDNYIVLREGEEVEGADHILDGPVNFADLEDPEDEDFIVIEDADGLLRLL